MLGPPRHPSQLYEAVLEGIVLFAILACMFWKTQARYEPGKLVGAFLFFYGLLPLRRRVHPRARQQLDRLRPGDDLHMGQWLSLPMILGGLYLMLTAKKRRVRVEPIAGHRSRRVTPLERALRERIAAEGPITVEAYMEACNAYYYATRDPLGARGDFTTAPEISQMFGELIGAALADCWQRAGRPADAIYAELGPGRGTLAADALRVLRAAGFARRGPSRRDQPGAARAAGASACPTRTGTKRSTIFPPRPLLLVANEFFDALADPPACRRGSSGASLVAGRRPGVRPRRRDRRNLAGARRGGRARSPPASRPRAAPR